ncbi:hypothetical protein IG631_18306 [Alternaria alternata]|nr:hypothetical protein IG631_18306 [Alternaria alternata]
MTVPTSPLFSVHLRRSDRNRSSRSLAVNLAMYAFCVFVRGKCERLPLLSMIELQHADMAPALAPESTSSNAKPTATTQATIKTPLPNPSLQVTADHNLKLQEAPVYAPKRGEVLLHIKATGVCGYEVLTQRGCQG